MKLWWQSKIGKVSLSGWEFNWHVNYQHSSCTIFYDNVEWIRLLWLIGYRLQHSLWSRNCPGCWISSAKTMASLKPLNNCEGDVLSQHPRPRPSPPSLRVGIAGVGVEPSQFMSTDTHFWVKIGLKFQSLGKISNISMSDPRVLLGQFQHFLAYWKSRLSGLHCRLLHDCQ